MSHHRASRPGKHFRARLIRLITFGQMARAGVAINLLGACVLVPFLWFWVFPLLGVAVGP